MFSHPDGVQNDVVCRNAAILNFPHSSAELHDIDKSLQFCQVYVLSYILVLFYSCALIIKLVIMSQAKSVFFAMTRVNAKHQQAKALLAGYSQPLKVV